MALKIIGITFKLHAHIQLKRKQVQLKGVVLSLITESFIKFGRPQENMPLK